MKDGSQTSADLNFSIYLGNWSLLQIPSQTPVASSLLTNSQFDAQVANGQNWDAHELNVATPPSFYTLLANTTYTAVLTSSAADVQSKAYFIKAGNVGFASSSAPGTFLSPTDASLVPEPSVLSLLSVGLGCLLRRRRGAASAKS